MDTEAGRTMSGEVRTSIWISEEMRVDGVISSDNFLKVMLQQFDENDEYADGSFSLKFSVNLLVTLK